MQERARSRDDKEARRRAILDAAASAFAASAFDELTMSDVARRAGLAKGTLYLYFPTKETLLLALLERSLERYLGDLERAFAAADAPREPDAAAERLVAPLLAEDALPRLLAILGPILEHNVPQARIRQFKTWLHAALARTGASLEQRLGYLGAGGGMRALLHLQALVAGLSQVARPAPAVARVLARPELAAFRLDFGRELRETFAALLRDRAASVGGARRAAAPAARRRGEA